MVGVGGRELIIIFQHDSRSKHWDNDEENQSSHKNCKNRVNEEADLGGVNFIPIFVDVKLEIHPY